MLLHVTCRGHKYASNVIEKALQCATPDERALLVEAICGQQNDPHPPLLVMMRDRRPGGFKGLDSSRF